MDRRDRPSEHSDNDYDRQSSYNRNSDRYSDMGDDNASRHERNDDRYDERRDRYNDRYDDRPTSRNHYDDRDRPPSVPPNKPFRDNYD